MFGSEVAFLLSVYICVNIEEVLGVAAITCLRIEFSSAAIDIIQEALLEFSVGLYYPTPPHLWYLLRLTPFSQTSLEKTIDLPFLPSSPASS